MYGNRQPPAGEQLESMGEGQPASAGADAGESQPVKIPAENLPPGIKEGDCLRCTGMDESGCTFTLEKGEGKEEEGTPWEDDFRKEMSPDAPQEGAA